MPRRAHRRAEQRNAEQLFLEMNFGLTGRKARSARMSKNDAWFATTICGPSAARCSSPDSVTGIPAPRRTIRAQRTWALS